MRVAAARALARISAGESLRPVLSAFQEGLPEARDRALLSAIVFAATRWWLRLDGGIRRMLASPLPARAGEVHALLVAALAQLEVLGQPGYAVVAASVEAVRRLGHGRHAGLVNALLRRWQRERAVLLAELDTDPVTASAHPAWLLQAIGADWPGAATAIVTANNQEPPLTLRVNRRRSSRAALQQQLAAAGVAAWPVHGVPDALVLEERVDPTRVPGFEDGAFSVQDGAAQRIAALVDPQPGQRVLDACAAPGGKAAHLLERADIELLALDIDSARLQRVHETFSRLGLAGDVQAGDAARPAEWWDGRLFDRILLDAPCSATGIIRRQPDVKLHRRASDIPQLATRQLELLDALWPLLAPGGRLVYATCSLLRAENEAVIEAFLAAQPAARALPVAADWGHEAGQGRQNLPGEDGMDGFFQAVLEHRGGG